MIKEEENIAARKLVSMHKIIGNIYLLQLPQKQPSSRPTNNEYHDLEPEKYQKKLSVCVSFFNAE